MSGSFLFPIFVKELLIQQHKRSVNISFYAVDPYFIILLL
ncbi:hypothetical protein BACCOP_03498 [Phocaeicola coprocola DSM 17136]|uniref:Uncharacterized protein n=1 Tax=Phocaeicola coprocola DSM 17136 TaxID=470145 RepID=B3JNI5_9BACT|nr:hypothetical protein BACCOP_03498 [Phocaeicola coprocola DSM 17136]